jgi:hypothetical protein
MKTNYVGILGKNRKNMPKMVKEKKLRKWEIVVQLSGPVCAEMG